MLEEECEAATASAVTGCEAMTADVWPLAWAAVASWPSLAGGDSCCSTACTTRLLLRSPTLTSTCGTPAACWASRG